MLFRQQPKYLSILPSFSSSSLHLVSILNTSLVVVSAEAGALNPLARGLVWALVGKNVAWLADHRALGWRRGSSSLEDAYKCEYVTSRRWNCQHKARLLAPKR